MNLRLLFTFLVCVICFACKDKIEDRYIFFLHNRFIETHELDELHPKFGKMEYLEIISELEEGGARVFSEIRKGNVNAREYALKLVGQIDSLVLTGVKPENITIIGTSKGGYIAQYVSTLSRKPNLNFVFVACFQNSDIENIPEIEYCGNILTIYEKSDPFGVSARQRYADTSCEIKHFKELEINTGLGHGFLFKPLEEWIDPALKWASGNYSLD